MELHRFQRGLTPIPRISPPQPTFSRRANKWLQGDLTQQANTIWLQRSAAKSWEDILEAAPDLKKASGMFRQWVEVNYIQSIAVAVRRMCDRDRRTRSLMSFLLDLKDHRTVLTREWWEDGCGLDEGTSFKSIRDAYLERFDIMSQGGEYVAEGYIQLDIDELANLSQGVRAFVDKNIAHLDARRNTPLTSEELHIAADHIFPIYKKWHTYICYVEPTTPFPGRWEPVFAQGWITQSDALKIAQQRSDEAGW